MGKGQPIIQNEPGLTHRSAPPKKRKSTSFSVEQDNLDYLQNLLDDSPLFRTRSRSDTLNFIIDNFKETYGIILEMPETLSNERNLAHTKAAQTQTAHNNGVVDGL